MIEHIADDGSGFLEIYVPLIMSFLVVDFFQVIAVENTDGELRAFVRLVHFRFHLLYANVKCALIMQRCQSICVSQIVQI